MDLMWEQLVWQELSKAVSDPHEKAVRFHDLRNSVGYKILHDRYVAKIDNGQDVARELKRLLET